MSDGGKNRVWRPKPYRRPDAPYQYLLQVTPARRCAEGTYGVDRCDRPTTELKSVNHAVLEGFPFNSRLTIAKVMRRSSHPSFIAESDLPHILPRYESVDKIVQTITAPRRTLPL